MILHSRSVSSFDLFIKIFVDFQLFVISLGARRLTKFFSLWPVLANIILGT